MANRAGWGDKGGWVVGNAGPVVRLEVDEDLNALYSIDWNKQSVETKVCNVQSKFGETGAKVVKEVWWEKIGKSKNLKGGGGSASWTNSRSFEFTSIPYFASTEFAYSCSSVSHSSLDSRLLCKTCSQSFSWYTSSIHFAPLASHCCTGPDVVTLGTHFRVYIAGEQSIREHSSTVFLLFRLCVSGMWMSRSVPEKPSLKNDLLGAWLQNGAFSTTKNQRIIRAYANLTVSYPPVVILPSPRRVQRLHHNSWLMVPPIAFFWYTLRPSAFFSEDIIFVVTSGTLWNMRVPSRVAPFHTVDFSPHGFLNNRALTINKLTVKIESPPHIWSIDWILITKSWGTYILASNFISSPQKLIYHISWVVKWVWVAK
jgi:hypothetical protein